MRMNIHLIFHLFKKINKSIILTYVQLVFIEYSVHKWIKIYFSLECMICIFGFWTTKTAADATLELGGKSLTVLLSNGI